MTFIHKHHLNLITLSSLYDQLRYMSPWSSFVFICSPFPPLLYRISSFSPQWEPLNIHPVGSDPSIYLSVLFSVTSSLYLSRLSPLLSPPIPLFPLYQTSMICLPLFSFPSSVSRLHLSLLSSAFIQYSYPFPALPHTPPVLWGHALKGITFSDHLCRPSAHTHTHTHFLQQAPKGRQ